MTADTEAVDRASFAAAISDVYTPEGVLIWLFNARQLFNGRCPVQVVLDNPGRGWHELALAAEHLAGGPRVADTTDAQKIAVLRDEVLNLRERNRELENENARLNGQTHSSTPAQENALDLLRLPANAAGMPYRGTNVAPATWDNLARRGLIVITWTITGARPDGIVTLAPEQTP